MVCIIKIHGGQVLGAAKTKVKGKDTRIQWHEAFVAAMKLELGQYINYLEFYPEYELTRRPKFIDLILIKREDCCYSNGVNELIGLFSKYNVVDYKGVGDRFDIKTLIKGIAYTCMYIMELADNWSISGRNVALIFFREAKPVRLFRMLKESYSDINCCIAKVVQGVYNINVTQLFEVKVIVLREIDFDIYPWLSALTDSLDEKHAEKLLKLESNMVRGWEFDNAEVVMDAVMTANVDVFGSVIGGKEDMCKAMWDLMKPQIDAYVAEKDAKIKEQEILLKERGGLLEEQGGLLKEQEAEIKRLKAMLAQFTTAGNTI